MRTRTFTTDLICVPTVVYSGMIRLLFFIGFSFTVFQSHCQSDLLKKYTYLVYCKGDRHQEFIGAGFFIKSNKKQFFITANHLAAATPCNTLTVVLDKENDKVYDIDVSHIEKKVLSTNFGEKDVLIYKIDGKLAVKINSIERFIPNYRKLNRNQLQNVVYFGYPKVENESEFDFKTTFPTLVMSQDTIIGHYDYVRFNSKLNKYDSVNYLTRFANGSYSGEGDSGAPVFFQIGNKYFFGGMCTSGVDALRIAYILRPEIIIEELSKKN